MIIQAGTRKPMALELRAPTGTGLSASILLDGQDVTRHCNAIDIHGGAGSRFTAEIGFVAGPALDVMLAADVTVQIQAFEGHDVVAEPQGDGSTRYRVERTPDPPEDQGDGGSSST